MIIVYVTHKNMDSAVEIIKPLIEKKIIACANYFPIQSCYFWNNKIQNSDEIVSILKTRKENWDKVKKEISKNHPYNTPCIIKIDVETNKEFEKWVGSSTR